MMGGLRGKKSVEGGDGVGGSGNGSYGSRGVTSGAGNLKVTARCRGVVV